MAKNNSRIDEPAPMDLVQLINTPIGYRLAKGFSMLDRGTRTVKTYQHSKSNIQLNDDPLKYFRQFYVEF